VEGERLDLTPSEFDFLVYLARNAGKVSTRKSQSSSRPGLSAEGT
jgi:DNA-binding response OmpR family regulator